MPIRCPAHDDRMCRMGCTNVCLRDAALAPVNDPWPICHVTKRECQSPELCVANGCGTAYAVHMGDRRVPLMADGTEWHEAQAWRAIVADAPRPPR